MCARAWRDQLINQIRPIRPPSKPRAKVVCCKSLTTLSPDQCLLNHQESILAPYESSPMANKWSYWGSLTPLQRCSRHILQPQPTGWQFARIVNLTLIVCHITVVLCQTKVGWVLWHIKPCRLFNAKSCLYLYKTWFVGNISDKPEPICLDTAKWFQVLLCNANNSTSVICLHS